MKDSSEGSGMFAKAQRSRVYYLVNSWKIPPGGADDQLATGSGSILLTLWGVPFGTNSMSSGVIATPTRS